LATSVSLIEKSEITRS